MSDPFDVDVVIIGAGFSGLTVATELRHDGISFVLLEAGARSSSAARPRHVTTASVAWSTPVASSPTTT